jgi:uncharacterized caspase-like protein
LRRLLFFAAALLLSQPAWAGNRVALVIGNSAYKNVASLPNPANDAAIVDSTLKGAGFDSVEIHLDIQLADMRRVLRDFADAARNADIAVVYYAGHGVEVDGSNYLIPTDAKLERDIDVYDEALSLDRVLAVIEPAKQLRLVILDACRDNPFVKTMKRTISRGIGRGLAQVEPMSPNTLVAYSAKAGSTAQDGIWQSFSWPKLLRKRCVSRRPKKRVWPSRSRRGSPMRALNSYSSPRRPRT